MKKYIFWLVLALVLVGVGIWYWKNNKPNTDKDTPPVKDDNSTTDKTSSTKTETTTPSTTQTNKTSSSVVSGIAAGVAAIKAGECGSYELLLKKMLSDAQFRNQTLSSKEPYRQRNKCQTTILQYILNAKEKASLKVDGDFGPATEAAVFKAFAKKELTLNDVDAKYKISNIPVYKPKAGSSWIFW